MTPEAIDEVLLVRAVEESDPKCERLRMADREHAAREAADHCTLPPKPSNDRRALDPREWAFIHKRAEILCDRARVAAHTPGTSIPTRLYGLAFLSAAFLAGCLTHFAGLAGRFDIRAGPFLFVLLWNAVIYAALAWHAMTRFRSGGIHDQNSGIGPWLARRLQDKIIANSAQRSGAAIQYKAALIEWMRSWIGPLLAGWIHVASVCFASGLVVSVYWHAYWDETYEVGWDSNLAGARHIRTVWGSLLRPASAVTGITLPNDDAAWENLKGFKGRNARPWIHLHAVTVGLFVGVPRLALAAWALTAATVRRRRPPDWKTDDPYVRRLFAMAYGGDGIAVAVLPFGFKRSGRTNEGQFRDAVSEVIRKVWGWRSRPVWLPEVAYGDQEQAWDGPWRGADDYPAAIVLCDARATPEAEVHGVLFGAVARRFRADRDGILALLECAEFERARLPARIEAWQALGHEHGLRFLAVEHGTPMDESVDLAGQLPRD